MSSVYFIIIFIIVFSLIMSIILSYFEKKEKRICNEIEEYIEADEIVNVGNEENNVEIKSDNNMGQMCYKNDNKDFSRTIVVESIESLGSKINFSNKKIVGSNIKINSTNKCIESVSNKIDSSNKNISELPQLRPYSIVDDDII